MRTAGDLSRQELEAVVTQVQVLLWGQPAEGAWDPDKGWDAETLADVAGVLEGAGLKPAA